MEFSTYLMAYKGFLTKRIEVHQHGLLDFVAKQKSIFSRRVFNLYDINGDLALVIRRRSLFSRHKFDIIRKGEVVASIEKKALRNAYLMRSVEGNYSIHGNFKLQKYKILKGDDEIGLSSQDLTDQKDKHAFVILQHAETDLLITFLVSLAMAMPPKSSGR